MIRIAKSLIAALALLAPMPAAQAQTWQGGYVGLYAGAAFGNSDIGTNALCDRPTANSLFCSTTGAQANAAAINAAGSASLSQDAFVGGALAGYSWQTGTMVYGIEGDFGSMRLKGSVNGTGTYPSGVLVPNTGDPFAVSGSFETSWLATLRGRLGYSFGNVMVFASGGLAFTELKTSGAFNDVEGLVPFIGVGSSSASSVKTGWTIGGGAEMKLIPSIVMIDSCCRPATRLAQSS